jgi:penicillin-binding protein 2
MIPRTINDRELLKTRLLLVLMLLAFSMLAAFLWRIQVAAGKEYQEDINRQSVRRVRVPGMRGRIYDRNGVCLANNDPSYCIALYLEELRQPGSLSNTIGKVMGIVEDISGKIGLPPQLNERDVRLHMRKRLPLPLIAWRDLDEQAVARWAERASGIAGADLYVETTRVYPEQETAAHLLGYVGRAAPRADDQEVPYHYYMPEMKGRAGLEEHFDEYLRGRSGGSLVRVDVSGYKYGEIGLKQALDGSDIMLTLDTRIQQIAEKTLAGRRGAVVVLDPSNGDVLALASAPGFNPNIFVPSISQADWDRLRLDPEKPLLNRAVAGEYAPGSTFKPVVAMAALEDGQVDETVRFDCPGHFELGGAVFHCWYHPGHGPLNVREALMNSCNVYFFKAALQSGHQLIYHMASALGLGRRTGIEVQYEANGLLPDERWKRETFHDGWRDGDTCNLSIGQGYLTATPLQMAAVTATLANKGTRYKPRILKGVKARGSKMFSETDIVVTNRLNWNEKNLELVRGGMRDVVMHPRGTGKRARIFGVQMAGKTGTAEYGRKGSGKKYGWMIAFAPFDSPQYAAVILVEEAVSGGVTAAPLMHNMMQEIFYGPVKTDVQEDRG